VKNGSVGCGGNRLLWCFELYILLVRCPSPTSSTSQVYHCPEWEIICVFVSIVCKMWDGRKVMMKWKLFCGQWWSSIWSRAVCPDEGFCLQHQPVQMILMTVRPDGSAFRQIKGSNLANRLHTGFRYTSIWFQKTPNLNTIQLWDVIYRAKTFRNRRYTKLITCRNRSKELEQNSET
jgi:hypothetical protein